MMRTVFLLGLSAAVASSQSGSGQGRIQGFVNDPSGQSISNANLTLRSPDTGLVRKLLSDAEGRFSAVALPVGTYELDAAAPGFATKHVTALQVRVGETTSAGVTLELAAANTTINVESAPQIVSLDDTHNSVSINERSIRELPIRGRNFVEFVQLTPNVMQEGNRYGLVVNGQRSINANISVDGVDFNDSLQGGQRGGGPNESAYFFPQLAVREFQVVASGVSAEVGRTNSGYVNVVTRSGSNTLHGETFFANRNGSLTSKDAYGNDSSSNAQNQFGGAMGGAIRKDKLFFFGAVEKNLVTIPYTVKFNTPTGNVAIPQEILSQQGSFNQKNNPLVAFGRLDYNLSQSNTVNFQYTYAAQYGLNFGGVSGQTNAASTNNTILDRASQGVKGGVTTVVSPSVVNEIRAQYAYDNRQQVPNSRLAEVTINDLGTLGGSKNGTYIYEATRAEVIDNLTWTRGRHTVKAGFDLNFSPQRQQRETNYGGVYTFRTLSDYLAAVAGDNSKINRYQQSIAANGTQGLYEASQQDHAWFLNDTIKLRRDLTISAGLRWDFQLNPQPTNPNPAYPVLTGRIPNDLKMAQPRLGIAWNVAGKDTTVIRLSAGLYDARTPAYLMQRVFTDNGLNTLVLDTSTDSSVLRYLKVPNRIDALPAGVRTPINSIYAFDPAFRNPRSGQMSAAFEQKITAHTKVAVSFTRNSTWNLQRRLDRNLFPSTTLPNGLPVYPTFDSAGKLVPATGYNEATGQPIFTSSTGAPIAYSAARVARPDATLGQINVNSSVAHSAYNGLAFTVQHRMNRRLQFTANYTYATNKDDDTNERDFNRQPALDTFNLKRDAAYAKNDIRHSGNFNALYDLGRGFTVSTLLFARTGIPVKPVVGADNQNDGNTVNDRPVINGQLAARDAFRQPGFFDWDVRLLKRFQLGDRARLEFSAEVFNLTRSTNKTFNGDGETTFGSPTATKNPFTGFNYSNNTAVIPTFAPGTDRFGGPRQGQLGVRLIF
ncbi:MAG: carboxypeptidase regulatory-like domain-containing protein [Bryobacteraceae bacterium]